MTTMTTEDRERLTEIRQCYEDLGGSIPPSKSAMDCHFLLRLLDAATAGEPAGEGIPYARYREVVAEVATLRAALAAARDAAVMLRPVDDWHEDIGDVMWFRYPIEEPPMVTSPISSDWPGDDYFSGWIPLPRAELIRPAATQAKEIADDQG